MLRSRAAALLLATAALAGCGGGGDDDKDEGERARTGGVDAKRTPDPPGSIRVDAHDSKFTPGRLETKAGQVKIVLYNKGKIMHRLGIVQTNRASGDLPVVRDQISETRIIEEIAAVEPGKKGTITVQLDPGRYVIVDNLPGHYTDGMHGELIVR